MHERYVYVVILEIDHPTDRVTHGEISRNGEEPIWSRTDPRSISNGGLTDALGKSIGRRILSDVRTRYFNLPEEKQ